MSQWKSLACIGFPNYEVSEDGRVRHAISLAVKAFDYSQARGYLRMNLWSYYKAKEIHCTVHRMVAIVWCPNPLNKPYVNHDDEDIWHNHRLNLRWMTPKENRIYSIEFKRKQLMDGCPF